MKKRRLRPAVPVINVTALVDVLLFLVIILLIAMPLHVKRLPVELPKTGLGGTPVTLKALPVSIPQEGELLVRGASTSDASIQALITSDTTVELSVDRTVSYEKIAKTLSMLQERSPREIILLTQ